jgi:Flp pilus assembly pilin Flp
MRGCDSQNRINRALGVVTMRPITRFLRALIRDDRGAAVAEYSMIVTVLIGVVAGLMMLGTDVSDYLVTIGSLLRGLAGHY